MLGRIKNAIGCISQLSERRKTPKVFYLTFGVQFILTHPRVFSHKPLQNGVHLNDLKHTPFELISTFPVEKAKSDLTQVIRFI